MCGFYKNFLVERSRIKASVINLANGPATLVIFPSDDSFTVSPIQAIAVPGGRSAQVGDARYFDSK